MRNQPEPTNIELGLSVLCAIAEQGESLTQQEIADVCDCSRATIWTIEKRALRKAHTRALKLNLQDFLED